MLRLTPEHYKTLSRLKRQPDGAALIGLLQGALDEAQLGLRTASGERIGWLQGESQCLALWLKHFEDADRLGQRS